MIYRILTGGESQSLVWDSVEQVYPRRPFLMLGAGTTLSAVMWELHLPAPAISNPRARFWFTDRRRGDRP